MFVDFRRKPKKAPVSSEEDRIKIAEFPPDRIIHLAPGYAWNATSGKNGLPDSPMVCSR